MSTEKIVMSKIIGPTIKAARKNKGLTLTALADLVSTSAGHLSDIENGKSTPGGDLLISLQRNLEINFSDRDQMPVGDAVAELKTNYSGKSPKRMMLEDLLDQESDEDLEELIYTLLAKKRRIKDGN